MCDRIARRSASVEPDGEFFAVCFDGDEPTLTTRHVLHQLIATGELALQHRPAEIVAFRREDHS